MSEPAPAPAPAPSPAPAPAPWHNGIDAETIGHWQNKGWKVDDPKDIATQATKQARDLERHFGVPPDQLLKMPQATSKPEDIAAFWQRLGAPKEAKDYDFSTVKTVAGEAMPEPLANALRSAALSVHLPKDAAAAVAAAVQKHLDGEAASAATVNAGKLAEEKAKLAQNWGTKYDFNKVMATEGARRLGISPEAVAALENQVGYAAVMEAMRKIGAGTSEDTFTEGGPGQGTGHPTTLEGAKARLADLQKDKEWSKRLRNGDTVAAAEWTALTTQIANAA